MKTKKLFMTIMILTLTALLALASAEEAKTKPADAPTSPTVRKAPKVTQTVCPVCGIKIKKDISIYYKGTRIYFDKEACRDAFFRNPDQFAARMEKMNIAAEKVSNYVPKMQDVCPFTGKQINKNFKMFLTPMDGREGMMLPGGIIYFCSEEYLKKFEQMPEPQRYQLAWKLINFGYKIEQMVDEK